MCNVMRNHLAAVMLVFGVLVCACSGSDPMSLPTAPTPNRAPASVPGGVAVSGKVLDTANRPLAGATVEVINGPSAGVKSTTGVDGSFNIFGAFDAATEFRATHTGHEDAVSSLGAYCERCNPHHWVYFSLGLPVSPANISGDYTMTIVAAAACTALPEHARRRVYSTRITPMPDQPTSANTNFFGTVIGANLVSNAVWEGLWFKVAGDYTELVMGDLHGQPGLIERTDINGYYAIGGVGIGSATVVADGGATITMMFDGEVAHCELQDGALPLESGRFNCPTALAVFRTVCQSGNHQLTLTRR